MPQSIHEAQNEAALLKTGALQDAIFNSANFSSIATDEAGVIQLFNVGAERMLGYAASEVVDKITILELKAARLSGERQINAKLWAIQKQACERLDPVQNG